MLFLGLGPRGRGFQIRLCIGGKRESRGWMKSWKRGRQTKLARIDD